MNYTKNTKKNVANRILVSWILLFIIGAIIGGTIIGCYNGFSSDEEKIYGTNYELTSKTFNEWKSKNVDFKPLNVPLDENIQEFVYYLSDSCDIDFPFVMAVIKQESNFNLNSASPTNDHGLMQINSCNHQWLSDQLGISDFYDPYQNIYAGVYILKNLFEKYSDPAKVLMAYNMGEYGASKLWNKGIYESNYSRKIMKYHQKFQTELKGVTYD